MTNEVREKGGRKMTSVAVMLTLHHRKKVQLLRHLVKQDSKNKRG